MVEMGRTPPRRDARMGRHAQAAESRMGEGGVEGGGEESVGLMVLMKCAG